MPQRVFLGYDSPFLPKLVEHLLSERESLAETLVIVPTNQSGRTLRESLAASAKAILAPTFTTPGALLHLDNPEIAPRWLEKIAWIETLETLSGKDWQDLDGLFPVPPKDTKELSDWAVSLASEIVALRTTLQDHLHNLFSASKFLRNTPEQRRWEDLARLEALAEKKLSSWGFISRSSGLRSDFQLPTGFKKIVLAGVTEMPACLSAALASTETEVVVLVAAPEALSPSFSELGIPLSDWKERPLPQSASVSIHADPSSQAQFAIEIISSSGSSSQEVAIGSADDQVGSALASSLTKNGWPAFFPASQQPLAQLVRWMQVWKNWLTEADSRSLTALFTVPESDFFVSGSRASKLKLLNEIRDRHPAIDPAGVIRILAAKNEPEAKELQTAISNFLKQREDFLSRPFPKSTAEHIACLKITNESFAETVRFITDFLENASPVFAKIDRSHTFWLQVLLSEIPSALPKPPADRAIDIQGWLELLFEPGAHLLICGMNDTFVPARSGGEPWLSENIRAELSLNSDADRHARDAFLLHAMVKMREQQGSAHLLCGKNGSGGETYLPSRLLLEVPRENLVSTVKNLSKEIEPPEANLVWNRDWKWETPSVKLPERISVTALKDYLSCPFRFYLKHLVRANQPEPDRREMNARDFGSITHKVLENWGNDPEARTLSDKTKLTAYFDVALEEAISRGFGNKPPLAIRIQTQAIRQRLEWFASQQATVASEGWEIIHIERKIAIPSGDFTVRGMIDRIDRHRESGQLRVIDYKTGKVSKIESEHRQRLTARSNPPAHIPEDAAPFHSGTDAKGKPVDFLWKNLQLPLYAVAESLDSNGELPIPCYIHLGKTKENVEFTVWNEFSEEDLESAQSCMDWITSRITERSFWPPAEKVPYDDFSIFSQNEHLELAFTEP